ncbi:MAG: dinucleotide-binding protein [Thermoleophilia bacterium]|nr:dinucleotide-binding protein [Thermoleophilia bacterium]
MRITIVGRGGVGSGLAGLLKESGHDVSPLGREGGDASGADVVVLAVPGDSIADALAKVEGLSGQPVLDATNPTRGRPDGVSSLAHQVKSLTNAPVAKAFNANFARLYGELGAAGKRPSSLYCADDEAREVAEQLTSDAGYEPVYAGGLENAAALEDFVTQLMLPVMMQGRGPFFYRLAAPGEL